MEAVGAELHDNVVPIQHHAQGGALLEEGAKGLDQVDHKQSQPQTLAHAEAGAHAQGGFVQDPLLLAACLFLPGHGNVQLSPGALHGRE